MKTSKEEKEAIKMLDKFITEHKLYNIKQSDGLEDNIKIVLNLIEKLQKENEELKQDRNNNYQMIALAQNEVLGYMQGYEDGKKLKRSAVACVVENQQYYIIKKEIEHYKEYIEKLQKEKEELEEINNELESEKNEAIRRYNFETIPKQKIKDKIEELNKEIKSCTEIDAIFKIKQQQILQELLGDK